MTVNNLARVFEDCNFHIIDIAHQKDMGEYNVNYIIDRESWDNKTLELFDKEVKHCYVNDSYAQCVRVEVE